MRATFSGLELMRRALQASQQALDVVGQNVGNASVKGYSRQDVSLYAAPPQNVPTGPGLAQVGTGLTDARLVRYRDEFLDRAFRQRAADLAGARQWRRIYDQIEAALAPGAGDLAGAVDQLWAALQDLAARPAEPSARVATLAAAEHLAASFRELDARLEAVRRDADDQLAAGAAQASRLAAQVADLNRDIRRLQAAGQAPHALEDKRDLLLDELARLAGARWTVAADGQVNVYLGSRALVLGDRSYALAVTREAAGLSRITWQADGAAAIFTGGELGALQQARDRGVPEHIEHLQALARALAGALNAAHSQGYTPAGAPGGPFYTYTLDDAGEPDLATFRLAVADPGQLAAAGNTPPGPQDGEGARRLAAALEANIAQHPGLTGQVAVGAAAFYRALVAHAATAAQSYREAEERAELKQQQAEHMRQAVAGVSLDEEMTRLIQFQHAYGAAARLVTALDEQLERLIDRLGLVGR